MPKIQFHKIMFMSFIYLYTYIFCFSGDAFVIAFVCVCLDVSFRLDKCDNQTNTNVNVDGTMHKGPTSHSTLFFLRKERQNFPRHFPFFFYFGRKLFVPLLRSRHILHIQLLSHLTNYIVLYQFGP